MALRRFQGKFDIFIEHFLNIEVMEKKFERKTEQKNPTNPTGNINQKTNKFDIDEKTIKKQQNKK